MADSISIPDQFEFKEMLSHTFPGFFLAFGLFMLIDYLSPVNFTVLAMGSLTGLISFVGFIIIIGTILGVIIDGIHHTFIEDDIFDNFEAVYKLKLPIKRQLEAACPSYHDNFSRHFFLAKMGDKGARAKEFEDLFDQAYYRYSEFYSNIFISLVVFSIISPFYFFDIIGLPWIFSEGIGIASLLIACLCLKCSYTSYTTYLEAQSSAICGFIKDAKSMCGIECKNDAKNERGFGFYLVRYVIAFVFLTIPCISFSIAIPLNKILTLLLSIVLIIIIDYIFIGRHIINHKKDDKTTDDEISPKFDQVLKFLNNLARNYYCSNQEWEKDKQMQIENITGLKEYFENNKDNLINRKPNPSLTEFVKSSLPSISSRTTSFDLKKILSKSSSAALVSFISGLLLCMIVLALYYPPISLNVETTRIVFVDNIYNNTTMTNPVQTICLKNIGRELSMINVSTNGIEDGWLEFRNESHKERWDTNLTINKIFTGKAVFAQIRLNSSHIDLNNTSQGSYVGSIDIGYSDMLKPIPTNINLTKKR